MVLDESYTCCETNFDYIIHTIASYNVEAMAAQGFIVTVNKNKISQIIDIFL